MPRKLSDPLTEEDKEWLRSWNRGDEIPNDDAEQPKQEQTPTPDPQTPDPNANPNPDGGQSGDGSGDGGSGDGSQAEDPFNGEEPPEDYNDWTVPQLQHELSVGRKLPKTGNKTELVKRLQEDDEANPE